MAKTLILGTSFLLIFLTHYTARPAVGGMKVRQFGADRVPPAAPGRDLFALPVTLLVHISQRQPFRLSQAIITIAALPEGEFSTAGDG